MILNTPTKAHPYTSIYNTVEKVQAYWNHFKPLTAEPISYQDKWLAHAPLFEQISSQSRVCITLFDVQLSNRFLYAVDKRNVLGNNAAFFTAEDGVDFTMANFHPSYLAALLLMQQTSFQYIVDNTEVNKSNIILNFDALYKKSEGLYIHILQQAIPIESDNNGYPLLFLSYIHDITHLKKQSSANLIITTPAEVKFWNYCFENKKLEPGKLLTQQEMKVLVLLSEGKQTKEIAELLFISPHTAENHRRHLLAKTNCIDTTALVTYARIIGLI